MDSNYLSIEEYLDFPIEEVVKKALDTLNSVEEYDDIPSISNTPGWRGYDWEARHRHTATLHIKSLYGVTS